MVRHNVPKWRRSSLSSYKKYRSPKLFSVKNKDKAERTLPKWFLKAIVAIAACAALLFFIFASDYFKIKTVIVEGSNIVPSEDIRAFIPKGRNIFLFNIKDTKNSILTDRSEINKVEIYRGIPNAVKVVLLEREGRLVWQSGENKYLVSDQGDVARLIVSDEGRNLPLVTDKKGIPVKPGTRIVSPNFIAFIHNINNNFFDVINIKPLNFEVDETTFDVTLYTDAGFYVKLNSLRSSKKQLESLKTVLVNKRPEIKEYVDLRIDGWAYYK